MRKIPRGNVSWAIVIATAIVVEFNSEELLSEAAERWRGSRPWLTNYAIAALAGHLSGVLPPAVDIFHADNLLHRGIAYVLSAVFRPHKGTA